MTPQIPASVAPVTSNRQRPATTGQHALNQAAAARFLGVDVETLRRWAARGVGPRRSEFGTRLVRYRIADLEGWLDEHAVTPGGPAPP